jgi:hypothetical protein
MLFLMFKPLREKVGYYDEDGKTLKNFFLKTPIKFSRLTHDFQWTDTILYNTDGKHIGTDYAAPTGTLQPLPQEQLKEQDILQEMVIRWNTMEPILLNIYTCQKF